MVPCKHVVAMAMMWEKMEHPEEYVHDWYAKHTFNATYMHFMYPFNGPELWERTGKPPIDPPKYLTKSKEAGATCATKDTSNKAA